MKLVETALKKEIRRLRKKLEKVRLEKAYWEIECDKAKDIQEHWTQEVDFHFSGYRDLLRLVQSVADKTVGNPRQGQRAGAAARYHWREYSQLGRDVKSKFYEALRALERYNNFIFEFDRDFVDFNYQFCRHRASVYSRKHSKILDRLEYLKLLKEQKPTTIKKYMPDRYLFHRPNYRGMENRTS